MRGEIKVDRRAVDGHGGSIALEKVAVPEKQSDGGNNDGDNREAVQLAVISGLLCGMFFLGFAHG